MSGILDSSVIVRYLIGEPAAAANQAERILSGDDELTIPAVVLAEVGWVLSSQYRVPRSEIIDLLVELLRRHNVRPLHMDKSTAIQALLYCRPSGRVSFVDAMTWALARSSGIGVVYSFDRRFLTDGIEVRETL
jgi:predicted nucleic acid-binding protein